MRLAWEAIVRNRVRSLLTMLGMIIGVGAVVITISIGVGARAAISAQITGLGSNLLIVIPGSVNLNGVQTGTGAASTLTPDDGLAIVKLYHVAAVSPLVGLHTQAIAGSNNWYTGIAGVAPSYTYIREWHMASGRFFTDADEASSAKVCVLGQTVIENLFPDGDSPLGKTVLVHNVPFTVIGTLARRGQSASGQDQDDTILIPFTASMQRVTGTTFVNVILVSADDGKYIPFVQNEIFGLLRQRHRITGAMQDDFDIRNLQDIANAAASSATTMELLLAGVAVVSLLVGGIGIMNIMLVSVSERTREIGLRIAVGARSSSILLQFLIEAVVLSGVGGLIGVLLGVIGSGAVAIFGHWPMAIPIGGMLLAFGFA
ncbi:MAG TPA: ABC transporter permease, partial [Candidatus Acidoferrales bacterium]|nr:ABC transporter permease [Candidatus Acidoferrales bacterium]